MTNAEIWYNISNTQAKEFEKVDRLLFQKTFKIPASVPQVSLYLEFGVMPITVIFKVRRLTYLHSILRSPRSGMLFKFFFVQWNFPCNGDWTEQIKCDLYDFGLECNLDLLASKSKESFKNMIKTKAMEFTLNNLLSRKTLSKKLENINYKEVKMQKYLLDKNLTYSDKKVIFLFRTRMAMFGENYKAGRAVTTCPLCNLHVDSQALILQCPVIKMELANKFGPEHMTEIDQVYGDNISKELALTLNFAMEKRSSLTKTK